MQACLYCVNLLRNVPCKPIFLHKPLTALPHYNVQQRVSKGGENRRRRHVGRRDPPTGVVSKSGRPWLSRQEACCCSCFVDRSRGGSSGNAPRLPWQHKQATKTVSRHKPRYHVSHDAIRRGKTSRCPLSELVVFHPPPLILTQPLSHSFVCSIPGQSVMTECSVEPKATERYRQSGDTSSYE